MSTILEEGMLRLPTILNYFSLDEKCFASRLFALNETQDIILK